MSIYDDAIENVKIFKKLKYENEYHERIIKTNDDILKASKEGKTSTLQRPIDCFGEYDYKFMNYYNKLGFKTHYFNNYTFSTIMISW